MAVGEYVKKHFKALIPQFLQNHPTCFYQAFLVALSGVAEQLWEEVGFKCPSSLKGVSHEYYAFVNFLGPAFSLWMICFLASNMAKRLCQGQRGHCSDSKWWSSFGSVVFRTLVIPLAWIFVSLMDGDIFACFRHLPNCTMDSDTIFVDGINCTTDITRWNEANKNQSKLYGWYFAGVCLSLGVVGVTCFRCCSKRPYFPNFYSNILQKRERIEMEKFLEEGAEETAKENAGAIMMAVNDIKPKDWEAICMLHQEETNEQSADARKNEQQPTDTEKNEKQPTDAQNNADQSTGKSPVGTNNEGQSTGQSPVGTNNEGQPTGQPTAASKNEGQSTDDKKKDEQSTDAKKEYYSSLSEWVGKNPALLENYRKSVAEKKEKAQNPNSAPQGPASASTNDQKSTPEENTTPNVDGNQALLPNSDSVPPTEASPQGSAPALLKDQESAQARNQKET